MPDEPADDPIEQYRLRDDEPIPFTSHKDMLVSGGIWISKAWLKRALRADRVYIDYHRTSGNLDIGELQPGEHASMLRVENISESQIVELAREMDLIPKTAPASPTTLRWEGAWLLFEDDGSLLAQTLREELRSSGLPYHTQRSQRVYIVTAHGSYGLSTRSEEGMIQAVRDLANNYRQHGNPF